MPLLDRCNMKVYLLVLGRGDNPSIRETVLFESFYSKNDIARQLDMEVRSFAYKQSMSPNAVVIITLVAL